MNLTNKQKQELRDAIYMIVDAKQKLIELKSELSGVSNIDAIINDLDGNDTINQLAKEL